MNIKPLFKGFWAWAKRHSGKLLAGGAIISEVFGYYLMHKEAPIVRDRLDELDDDATWKEKFKVAAPVYLPAAVLLLVSSGCIIGGCVSGERKIALLTSLYSASEAAIRKCEDELVARVGPEQAKDVKQKAIREFVKDDTYDDNQIIYTNKGSDIFHEPFSGRYFTSDKKHVQEDIGEFERMIISEDEASVNDLFSCFGIPEVKLGKFVCYRAEKLFENKSRRGLTVSYEGGIAPNGHSCVEIKFHDDPYLYNGKQKLIL